MKIVLTKFAAERHFDPEFAGTTIPDRTPEVFESEANILVQLATLKPGYADFCKLVFLSNWTDARTGTMEIGSFISRRNNSQFLRTEYKARREGELPVLTRWLDVPEIPLDVPEVPKAKWLCLVLYSKEQLTKEEEDIGDAEYGIVAILGQMSSKEEPMPPVTMMRNALGIDEGGSGVPLDKKAYMRSVEFWNKNAVVKMIGSNG